MSLRLRLAFALSLLHFVASATLVRSVLYGRWITVAASVTLLAGAAAARRGKTWGIGVALGAAAAFPMARLLGMAPAWFWAVGVIGALPFLLTSRSLSRFDAKATAVGAWLAITTGIFAAVGWWFFGPTIVTAFPALRPSFWPAHEALASLTMAALALIGWPRLPADDNALAPAAASEPLAYASPTPALGASPPGVRVLDAPRAPSAVDAATLDDDELADEAPAPAAARGRRA
ncbi:MAG TPA: hypothetical protein VFS00_06975 [Polyangiaceae bacterium]|nr:hypothetical protein [Polyangiaceae bacterium]